MAETQFGSAEVTRGTASQERRPPKTAMLVAQRIVRDVVRSHMSPGELLPPERVMLEKYATGRGTLREALRLLEFQGVISLKPGPGGGPVLQTPSAFHLSSTLMLLMQLNHASYHVIVEVRNAIEPVISELAAEHISDAALAELSQTRTRRLLFNLAAFYLPERHVLVRLRLPGGNFDVERSVWAPRRNGLEVDFMAARRGCDNKNRHRLFLLDSHQAYDIPPFRQRDRSHSISGHYRRWGRLCAQLIDQPTGPLGHGLVRCFEPGRGGNERSVGTFGWERDRDEAR